MLVDTRTLTGPPTAPIPSPRQASSPWGSDLRLLVIDSVNTLGAPILGGARHRGADAGAFSGQLALAELMRLVGHLAQTCQLAAVVVNASLGKRQASRGGGGMEVSPADAFEPLPADHGGKHIGSAVVRAALGMTWPFLCATRLAVSRTATAADGGGLCVEVRAAKVARAPVDTAIPDAAIPTARIPLG